MNARLEHTARVLSSAALIALCGCEGQTDSERQAVAAIQRSGGHVDIHEGKVVRVRLGGPRTTNATLVPLKDLTRIERLDLDHSQVPDDGLVHVEGLTRLKRLHLSVTRITDAGLVHLAGLTSLELLDLSRTRVTDAGLVHLAGLTNLKVVDLSGTKITDDGVNALLRTRPNLGVQL